MHQLKVSQNEFCFKNKPTLGKVKRVEGEGEWEMQFVALKYRTKKLIELKENNKFIIIVGNFNTPLSRINRTSRQEIRIQKN